MTLFSSFRIKIIASFAVIALIGPLVIGLVSYSNSSKLLRKELGSRLRSDASRLSETYDSWLKLQVAQLETIASTMDFTDWDEAFYTALAKETQRLGYNAMSPTDLNGILHLSSMQTVDLSGRAYLKKVLSTQEPAISDPVFSTVPGEENLFTVLFAVPVFLDGRILCTLVAQRDAAFLSTNISRISYEEGSSNYVLSSKGIPVASTDVDEVTSQFDVIRDAAKNPALASRAKATGEMLSGSPGIAQYEYNGVPLIAGYAPVEETGWVAVIAVPVSVIGKPLATLKMMIIATILTTLIAGILLSVLIGIAFTKPVQLLADRFSDIASGEANLTQRIEYAAKDEFGTAIASFNQFIARLQEIITALRSTQQGVGAVSSELVINAHQSASAVHQIMANIESSRKQSNQQSEKALGVSGTVKQIAEGMEALDKMVETQVSGTTEVAASVEEMVGNIASVNQSISKMADSFKVLLQSADEGKEKQEAANESVTAIARQSLELMEANEVIAAIATQTNLLAMNAAIEAAHAGDAGKGFSVVADEIRKLSENSSIQSTTIGNQLNKIRESIQQVVEASNLSSTGFSTIALGVQETGTLVNQIESAMEEQQEGSRQILIALQDMNAVGTGVKDSASLMKEAAGTALTSMRELAGLSSEIRSSMDEMLAGATEITNAVTVVSNLASEAGGFVQTMEDKIGLFTV